MSKLILIHFLCHQCKMVRGRVEQSWKYGHVLFCTHFCYPWSEEAAVLTLKTCFELFHKQTNIKMYTKCKMDSQCTMYNKCTVWPPSYDNINRMNIILTLEDSRLALITKMPGHHIWLNFQST